MSSAKLRSEIIAARDRRQEVLQGRLSAGYPATVFLSLNIPGAEKNPPGAERLFTRALSSLLGEFPDGENLVQGSDPLGPYAIISIRREAFGVKRSCIVLECATPYARLIDLDVFAGSGLPVDRAALGMLPRPCLLCALPAVECIRLRRHGATEVSGKTDELLACFRD
jgi:holo-ACP synthase CitX